MSILHFWGVAHSEMGSVIFIKGEITLYPQNHEIRILKVSSMDFFLKTKGLTRFYKVILYAKSENQYLQAKKWRLIELICMFQDGRQNHTESYIVFDSLFNVPRNICGGSVLVFVLLYISLCSVNFCKHLDEEENDSCFALIVFLVSCDCKCSVPLSHDAMA